MEFPRDSELVYGADMCNRRLRGIKVNPIYQEKDASGTSEVDPSVPVGEIQIDMYESLPRKRRILKYSPDAILLSSTNKDGHTVIEWKYPSDRGTSKNNSPQKCAYSNTCTPAPDCACGKNVNAQQQSDSCSHTTPVSVPHLWDNSNSSISADMIRNNLNNNNFRIPTDDNGLNNDDGSCSSSSHKDINCQRDDSSIRECSPIEEQDEDNNGSVDFNKTNSNSEKAIVSTKEAKGIRPSADAIVAYATVEQSNPKNIYSVNDYSGELSDMEYSIKHSNKFLNDLDYITSRTIPVCPIDLLNNNHETVPDQMIALVHNSVQSSDDIASIKALQHSLSSTNSFDQSPHKNGQKIDKNGNGFVSKNSISGCACGGRPSLKCSCGRLALQKLLKEKNFLTKHDSKSSNDSSRTDITHTVGKTSNVKCNEKDDNKPTNKDPAKQNEESALRELNNSFEKELNDSSFIDNSEEVQVIDVDLGEDTNTAKSILVSKRRGSKIQECRGIKFAAGTIFNECKSKTKYAKERRRPVDVVSDNIKLDNLSSGSGHCNDGYDNPVFVCDEDIPDSVFFDETSFTTITTHENEKDRKGSDKKKSKKDSSGISVTELKDGSIVLKPGDLNVPAYMEEYIRNFHNNNNEEDKKKAPPVSIEALGGMTVADLADIEVAKDDGDYKRRRRKNNAYGYYDEGSAFLRKEQRIKNVKICVIVIVIFAVICTAIGLGVHFGGGANSTALTAPQTATLTGHTANQKDLLERAQAAQGVPGFGGPIF